MSLSLDLSRNDAPVVLNRADLEIVPHENGVCADIEGFNFDTYCDHDINTVKQAWLDYGVIRFKHANINDDQHVEFSRHFGEFVLHPKQFQEGKHKSHPEILSISNVLADGKPIGAMANNEATWHTDTWIYEKPPAGAFLRAIVTPPVGGETYFLSTYQAYQDLPKELRQAVDGRQLYHQRVYDKQGDLRLGQTEPTNPDFREWPGIAHPIVRTHGDTGRKCLFLGGTKTRVWILGMPMDESDEIVERLWAHVTGVDQIFIQEWDEGDMVVWDNRCTMHRRDNLDPNYPRVMHRTTTAGERPI